MSQQTVRERMVRAVYEYQDRICMALASLDGQPFREDLWDRAGGGGGRARTIEGGSALEKAGVNVSVVHGILSESAAGLVRQQQTVEERRFFATGLSLVIHPLNPHAPTVHANFRYFELGDAASPAAWWFGGGADLTPSYLYDDDARHFHGVLKATCDRHDTSYYPRFKTWCDEYFLLEHRGERRGLGGIFFDHLRDGQPEGLLDFVTDGMASFLPAYTPILERRRDQAYTPEQRAWQELRRGRYVEFNLLYDRGTTFGLRTDARVESVLMSLPPVARWQVDRTPKPGTPEARLIEVLREPLDWAE